ncbi:LOW QUALITY PROTEIN: histone-lysine N-methyltransferase SMYD3-like [Macrobrachium rosenbergii]|uniref:LOW QUALITY PROTEIN: histone-lysine N-methyltransferase SMYD3-like n=1 Tax=Macrobrachium rosenbergii TaxID=79674 RepID=UPI0034D448A8
MREHFTPYYGQYFTKKKKKTPLSKGDLVISSEPFAHIINLHHTSKYCDYCFVPQTKKLLKPCKGCRISWYCSESCAKSGWEIHRFECHRLQRLDPNIPPSFVRLLARIIFKLNNGGDKIIEKYSEKEGRRFRDLMNHYGDVKNDKESKMDVDYLINSLIKYIGRDNLPNYSDFLGIYGRVLVNRFCIFDETMQTFGSGVFLAASIFDHACAPNCYVSFDGRKVQIRSLVDMPELDYSKCRISYIDPVASVAARKEELHRKWYFWCDCKTCADEERAHLENSVVCETEDCNTFIHIPETFCHKSPPIECGRCGDPVDKEKIRRYRQVVTFTKYHLTRMSEDNPKLTDCLEVLEEQGSVLHSLNVWRVRTIDFAFNAAVHSGCWERALHYGDKNYEGMRYYYGDDHPTFALFLFKLGKAKIYLKEFREGVRMLDKAEAILKDAVGPTHPIIVDQLIPTNLLANEDIEICLERRMAAAKERERLRQKNKASRRYVKPIDQAA